MCDYSGTEAYCFGAGYSSSGVVKVGVVNSWATVYDVAEASDVTAVDGVSDETWTSPFDFRFKVCYYKW